MPPLVEILVGVAGDDFSWAPGDLVDMTDDQVEAWADGERARIYDRTPTPTAPSPPDTTAPAEQVPAQPEDVEADPDDEDDGEPELVPPPKSGPGSGVEAWRAYAAEAGVEVPDSAKREEIWTILEAEQVPTSLPEAEE